MVRRGILCFSAPYNLWTPMSLSLLTPGLSQHQEMALVARPRMGWILWTFHSPDNRPFKLFDC